MAERDEDDERVDDVEDGSEVNGREETLRRREIDFYRREKELAEKELELARREVAMLREMQRMTRNGGAETATRDAIGMNGTTIADLLN